MKTAMLVIHHPTKGSVHKAIHSLSGSLAFSAGPRLVFMVAKEGEDSKRGVLLPVVNKIGPEEAAVGYYIIDCAIGGIRTSRIDWDDKLVTITANQPARGVEIDNKSSKAEKLLKEMLSGGKRVDANKIMSAAKKADIGERTMKDAKARLGGRSFKNGANWAWFLPKDAG
jgi:hypothetical protein